jgi:integrase
MSSPAQLLESIRSLLSPEDVTESPTLAAWLDRWLDEFATDRCQSKTLERYRELARYVTDGPSSQLCGIATRPLSTLTHRNLESALRSLVGAPGARKALSVRTVRHVAGVIQSALRKAVWLELIPSNPMLKVELPSPERSRARGLTADEIGRLRDACRGDWTFPFVELALSTGCRRGELLALEWRDVDWRAKACGLVPGERFLEGRVTPLFFGVFDAWSKVRACRRE